MKLCQTIAVPTLKALRAERDEVRLDGPVSLIELRLDHLAPGELDVAGALSRMLPAKFSGAWTYAGAAAPGQFSVTDMVSRFHVHTTTAATRVFGIAGAPLSHSASPAMHNAAFHAAGLDAVFVPVETADADELRELAEALGFDGLAVTAPLKSRVLTFATPDADAQAIGAANTLKRTTDGWAATNFDAPAFREPLEPFASDLAGQRAVVIGAGGAARAAVSELTKLGAVVEVSARQVAHARALAAEFGAGVTAFPPTGSAALIVNATPIGTRSGHTASPVIAGTVTASTAYDLVYNPEQTTFLTDARSAGARTIGGLAMLVAQARRQFEWWTGQTVPPAVFEHAAREFIQ
jgi:3-dehydroquinate dehydratase/shikimate dehydrogenase